MSLEPIAIIGIGCRFPGADGPEAFWKLLRDGVDAIREVPPSRWHIEDYYDPDATKPDKTNSRWGGFLDKIDEFDPQFFGIAPREVPSMDPQQRLILEVAWEALEDGGQIPERLARTKTGVFVGIGSHDYSVMLWHQPVNDPYSTTGTANSIAANRLSYVLDLKGPSLSVDTACSSALVAVHLACQSIWQGESVMALAGGVNVLLSPFGTMGFTKGGFLSGDGRCKSFDASANGYVRAEGAGIVVLKPLSQAKADNDPIYAVIRGSAVNQDGRTDGMASPSQVAQVDVLRDAYRCAGVRPSQVQYIEAHGTGTKVGDRIEAQSLGTVVSEGRTGKNCLIGSVKSNIGHLETAAGIAGLIKVALSLKNQQIPPSLHFQPPNPNIDFTKLGLQMTEHLTPWTPGHQPRIAGVNSFGFGGTNAHIVLEEAPPFPEKANFSQSERAFHLLTLSAKTESALGSLCLRYQDFLDTHPVTSIANICFSANTRKSQFNHRLVIWGENREQLSKNLEKYPIYSQEMRAEPGYRYSKVPDNIPSQIVFLFTGQGSQYVNMGRELYETQPYFRQIIDQCAVILKNYLDISLIDLLYPDTETNQTDLIDHTAYTQPALFALEYAMAQLWQSWGITPSVVLGHSLGEYVAACVAGVFSLEDGLKLVTKRGQLMQNLPSGGAMVAVLASEEIISDCMTDYPDIAIAAINGSQSWVLSGKNKDIEAIIARLTSQGLKNTPLTVSHAFHSPLMKPMLAQLRQVAAEITYHQPKINIISNLTGDFITEDMANPDYWCLHSLSCVRFADSMKTLQKYGYQVFIEMGPQPILLGMGQNNWEKDSFSELPLWLPSLRPGYSDWQQVLNTLGELFLWGIPINWTEFDRPYSRLLVSLPTYPFQRQSYWWKTDLFTLKKPISHPLLGPKIISQKTSEICFQSQISVNSPSYLKEHCLNGTPVFPGAAYLEMALSAGSQVFPDHEIYVNSVKFEQLLVLTEIPVNLQLILREETPDSYLFEIFTLVSDTASKTHYASGRIMRNKPENRDIKPNLNQIKAKCPQSLSVAEHYLHCQEQGLSYGIPFQGVKQLWYGDRQGLSRIHLCDSLFSEAEPYCIHPTVLDACFQGLGAIISKLNLEKTYLPIGVEQLTLYDPCPGVVWSYIALDSPSETQKDILKANLRLWDDTGKIIGDIQGLSLCAINRQSLSGLLRNSETFTQEDTLYEVVWQIKKKIIKPGVETQNYLIFLDKGELGLDLANYLRQQGHNPILVFQGKYYQKLGEDYTLDPSQLEDFGQLFRDLSQNNHSIDNIVHLWGITEEKDLLNMQKIGCYSLLSLIQVIHSLKLSTTPRLYLVTRGTQAVTPDQTFLNPWSASIWGLGRVIRLEYPDLPCITLDLDGIPFPEEISLLTTEITSPDEEDQIAYRESQRYVPRLLPKKLALNRLNSPFQLKISQYGSLDNLVLVPLTHSSLKSDEVEIEVYAAGLNFRDVLNGLGMLQPYLEEMGFANATEIPFGGECAGKIVAIGELVTDFKVEDEVIAALALGSLASFVTVKAQFVTLKPKNLSFIEAATLPTAFLTAYYGLHTLARIKVGDRILIHSAAGGVGQAAVQLAQRAEAKVFATASSSKKSALQEMGVLQVMNSRTLDFADEIMRLTDGKGVDLILNSLNGEYIPKNLEILSENGRLIEIGKIGIWSQEQVKQKRQDISYFPFDLLTIAQKEPNLIAALWSKLISAFEKGDLKPLPHTVFPIEESVKAFRYMASAQHIGKVILTFPKNSSFSLKNHLNDAYLITGGWGALGLQVAQWLAEKGAKQLVLTGRSEPSPQALKIISNLQRSGTQIKIIKADLSDSDQVNHIFTEFNSNSPKKGNKQHKAPLTLRGVIHAAGVLDDGLLLNQNWERFETVMKPKIIGTWNLHQATKDRNLDFFVCFSSIVSLIGSPGQGNYSAANGFMDALMQHRRMLKLSGLSINWGPWSDSGMAADSERQNHFSALGIRMITPEWGLEMLEKILFHKEPQIGIFLVNWSLFLTQISRHSCSPFLSSVNKNKSPAFNSQDLIRPQKSNIIKSLQEGRNNLLQSLEKVNPIQQNQLLLSYLQTQVAKVLGFSSSDFIDPYQEFSEFGMDSLMAVELKNNLQADLGVSLATNLIFDYATVSSLRDYLFKEVLNSPAIEKEQSAISANTTVPISTSLILKNQDKEIKNTSFNLQKIESIPPQFYQFELSNEYLGLQYEIEQAKHLRNPFFTPHNGVATNLINIEGRTLINYASYNYLGLAGSQSVSQSAIAAIECYGTSTSASRILSGEIPLHQELEREIADFLGTEDCIVYIGGHTTNTTTIGHLFQKNDLILYDALSHNSIRQGCSLSGATALEFPHNDYQVLEQLLQQRRSDYEKVLIVIEGIYSTHGDIAPLPEIIALKKYYKTFLMVDEAHSIGVLGLTGRGIGEHFGVSRSDVDLWMGTLSKSFGSCGGYIAASRAIVQYLKYTSPGFVFSVGMSPANAAAALASIRLLKAQPERIKGLKNNAQRFLFLVKDQGWNTGMSQDSPIIPIIVGESQKAVELSNRLFQAGINVLPMIYPSVPHDAASLRFFLTFDHTEDQIDNTCNILSCQIRI